MGNVLIRLGGENGFDVITWVEEKENSKMDIRGMDEESVFFNLAGEKIQCQMFSTDKHHQIPNPQQPWRFCQWQCWRKR